MEVEEFGEDDEFEFIVGEEGGDDDEGIEYEIAFIFEPFAEHLILRELPGLHGEAEEV